VDSRVGKAVLGLSGAGYPITQVAIRRLGRRGAAAVWPRFFIPADIWQSPVLVPVTALVKEDVRLKGRDVSRPH
jgi:hypothetical protein